MSCCSVCCSDYCISEASTETSTLPTRNNSYKKAIEMSEIIPQTDQAALSSSKGVVAAVAGAEAEVVASSSNCGEGQLATIKEEVEKLKKAARKETAV